MTTIDDLDVFAATPAVRVRGVAIAIAIANTCPVIVSNLPFGSGDSGQLSSQAHLTHVSTR